MPRNLESSPPMKGPEKQPEFQETKEKLSIEAGGKTEAAEKHPDRNEDALLNNKEHGIFAVFDGMGGHEAGDIASKTARDYFMKKLKDLPSGEGEEIKDLKKVTQEASQKVGQNVENGGTAGIVAKIFNRESGERLAAIAGVGDCRAYIQTKEKFSQINEDHDQLNLDRQAGHISEQEYRNISEQLDNATSEQDLTEEGLQSFRERNRISQALDGNRVNPDINLLKLKPESKLLLTSDGVHDNLTTQEIDEILRQNKSSAELSRELVKAARERSKEGSFRSKDDDISAMVIGVTGKKPPEQDEKEADTKESSEILELPDGTKLWRGSKVRVVRSNGEQEFDWKLENIDRNKVEVTKIDKEGKPLHKKVPLDKFKEWQPEHDDRPGAGHMSPGERKRMAKGFGIDTSQEDWEKQLSDKLRDLSGG